MEFETINCQQKIVQKPLISVVVPIYKAEETLYRCLDSLKTQTFADFEVLMVDDGSPDQCGKMMDDYAAKDYRFKAFHKENGGVSSARQFGIDHACGEYIIHADPDDWVEPTMLEELIKKAKEDDADMVICDFYENTYRGQKYLKQEPSSCESSCVLRDLFIHLHGSCCNKLVRRDSLQLFSVRFPNNLNFCEDLYVNAALLKNGIRVSYLNKAFYHYVRNNVESLSRRYDEKSEKQNVVLRDSFTELFKDSGLYDLVDSHFSYAIVYKAFWGGKGYYTSKSFKYKFRKYISYIKNASNSMEKYLLLLSCWGGYHPVIDVVDNCLKLKHWLIHSIKRIV